MVSTANTDDEILALELQIKDRSDEILKLASEKEEKSSDHELTIRLELEAYKVKLQQSRDKRFAQLISRQIQVEYYTEQEKQRELLTEFLEEERRALSDHAQARELGGIRRTNLATTQAQHELEEASSALEAEKCSAKESLAHCFDEFTQATSNGMFVAASASFSGFQPTLIRHIPRYYDQVPPRFEPVEVLEDDKCVAHVVNISAREQFRKFCSEELRMEYYSKPDMSDRKRGLDKMSSDQDSAAKRKRLVEPLGKTKCCVCLSKKSDQEIFKAEICDHPYCHGCLREHFERSLKDVGLFPPRCCRASIPFESVQMLFDAEFKQKFGKRAIEFATKNPLYCSNRACSDFISHEAAVNDQIHCPSCQVVTCVKCKGRGHAGQCEEDPDELLLRAIAKQDGWQECPGCKNLVELSLGCYHMT
jgi:hypothetical protein